MADIVPFQKKAAPPIAMWRCACGCTSFQALSTDRLECCQCGELAEGIEGAWVGYLASVPEEEPASAEVTRHVVELNSPVHALKRILGRVTVGNTSFVAVVREDGWTKVWAGEGFWTMEGAERMKWTDDKLSAISDLLRRRGREE